MSYIKIRICLASLACLFGITPVLANLGSLNHYLPTSVSISAAVLSGPVKGFLQTPTGGQFGTTSYQRPTFDELGIKRNDNYNVQIEANWRKFGWYFGYNRIRLAGSNVLNQPLTTHSVVIPSGTLVNGKAKFDWYQMGGKYHCYFWHNKLEVTPMIEAALLDFYYGIPGYISPRKYPQWSARVGVDGDYHFNNYFSVNLSVATSFAVTYLNISSAAVKFCYTVFRKPHFIPTIFIGGNYTYIDFKDSQELPNHLQYRAPMVMAGMKIDI